MPLINVLAVQTRPESALRYRELIQQLASKAVSKKDAFHWTTHATMFGARGPQLHFVSAAEDYAEIAARGTPPELFERVLGAKPAAEWQRDVLACTLASTNTISNDRPDLSYPPDDADPSSHPFAMVTTVRARPGGQDAAEELFRKIAEAIPKVDDASRVIVHQTLVGNLLEYFAVRPLRTLAELDRHRTPQRLIEDAFGAAEGGLVFRSAMDAIEIAEREIVQYVPELSNPRSR